MRWSESDNYFVNESLKVYSVDLSSEPLKLVPEENVRYDGPKGYDFKSLLIDNGFRVNRQGKAIVGVPTRNDEEDYNFFLLERVVPLDPYGFTNVPSPTVELKVLKSLLEETSADLEKKNAEVDELHRKILDWNSEQLRLTLDAITESLKKVFVGVDDLKPPASGDPKSVLRFFEKLRDQIRRKEEFGATFLVAGNEILASIATTFYKRTGLSIGGMETTMSSPSTPADLIKSLSTLREFMGNRFFIDGSVIVKDFRLMNEKDIPAIFRDSEAGVAELHRKEKGAKSIDNIDGKSIFYGYFNIPSVGKFKGVLTRIDVTLPDEIMVKLRSQPNLDEKRFWFVKANGEAIFEKSIRPVSITDISSSTGSESKVSNLENVVFDSNRFLGGGVLGGVGENNFLGFLRRMNRTFVNQEGKYLKFEFTTVKFSGLPPEIEVDENSIAYYDQGWVMIDPFSRVQFDTSESPQAISEGCVSLPAELSSWSDDYFHGVLKQRLGRGHAFAFKNLCFIGNITEVSGADFRNNALVSVFFEHFQAAGQDCYVDALATTFFVCNPNETRKLNNRRDVAPKIN